MRYTNETGPQINTGHGLLCVMYWMLRLAMVIPSCICIVCQGVLAIYRSFVDITAIGIAAAELWAEQPRGPASVGRSLPAIRRDQQTGPDRDELKLVLNGRSEQSGGGAEGLGQVEKLGG